MHFDRLDARPSVLRVHDLSGRIARLFGWGRELRRDQLGPDHVPVVWTQVAAGDGATGGALDGNAVCRIRDPPGIPVLPLAHLRLALDANRDRELGN